MIIFKKHIPTFFLCLLLSILSIRTLFSQAYPPLRMWDFTNPVSLTNDNIKSNRILLLFVPSEEEEEVNEFTIEYTLPSHIKFFDKEFLPQKTKESAKFKAYSPSNGKISQTDRTIKLMEEKSIEIKEEGGYGGIFYFYVVPFAKGEGNITATYSWKDKKGNLHTGDLTSGKIKVQDSPIAELQMETNPQKQSYTLLGVKVKSFDQEFDVPSNCEYLYTLTNTKTNKMYNGLSSKEIYLKNFEQGTYNLIGTATHNGLSWDISKNNIVILETENPEDPK